MVRIMLLFRSLPECKTKQNPFLIGIILVYISLLGRTTTRSGSHCWIGLFQREWQHKVYVWTGSYWCIGLRESEVQHGEDHIVVCMSLLRRKTTQRLFMIGSKFGVSVCFRVKYNTVRILLLSRSLLERKKPRSSCKKKPDFTRAEHNRMPIGTADSPFYQHLCGFKDSGFRDWGFRN